MSSTTPDFIDDLRLLEPAHPFRYWWVFALVVLAIAGAAVFWRKFKRTLNTKREHEAVVQAREDALEALQRLRGHIAEGNSRTFAIEVSGVIRRYIETRFNIRAPNLSTEEFLLEARESPKLDEAYQKLLAHFLGCCDFIKFARGHGDLAELQTMYDSALRFVSETRPPASAIQWEARR